MRAALLALALVGCATGAPTDPTYQPDFKPRPSPEQMRQADVALARCHLAAARELDDGRSDAGTIARAVDSACQSDSTALLDMRTRGISAYERRDIETAWPKFSRDAALAMVLRVRNRDPQHKD